MKLTDKQFEILSAIDSCSSADLPCDGWGEVWTHCDTPEPGDRIYPLAMRNFDRAADALQRHGLITVDGSTIELTERGRRVLSAQAERRRLERQAS